MHHVHVIVRTNRLLYTSMDYHEKGNVLWGEYLILVENDSFDVLGALCKECFSLFFSFKSVNAIYILLTFIYFCQAQFQLASQA